MSGTSSPSELPDALRSWDALVERLADRRVAVFLDYDGTLTAVRTRPQDAVMSASMRAAVEALAQRCEVAIVTGRGMADVRAMVDLPELVYAANHGLEIAGPGLSFEPDVGLRSTFEALRPEIDALVAGLDDVVVEHKGLSTAIHVRHLDAACIAHVEEGIDRLVAENTALRKGVGKMCLELRPALHWHKGAAVGWLCDRMERTHGAAIAPIFMGDDRTDEDAMIEVRDRGIGILVGNPEFRSEARFGLAAPQTVEVFIRRLHEFLSG